MAEVDLSFLARQIERVLANDSRQHDDITVLTAIFTRLDNSVMGLVQEMRTVQDQIARMDIAALADMDIADIVDIVLDNSVMGLMQEMRTVQDQIARMSNRMDHIDTRLDHVDARLERIASKLDGGKS